jgi:hypothetical protein
VPEVVVIPFDSGPRQDASQAVAPGIYRVQDGRKRALGGWGKRHSYTSVGRTTTSTSSANLGGVPNAVGEAMGRDLVASGDRIYARDSVTAPSWHELGRVGRALPRKSHWINYSDVASGPLWEASTAALGNYIATTYSALEVATGTAYVVLEVMDPSGVRIFKHKEIEMRRPRVIAVGTTFVWAYESSSPGATDLYARTFVPTTLVLGTQTSLFATGGFRHNTDDHFDVCPFDTTQFQLAVRNAATTLTVIRYNLSFAAVQTGTAVIANALTSATVFAVPGEGTWVSVLNGASTYIYAFTDGSIAFVGGGLLSSAGPTQAYMVRRSAFTVWAIWREKITGPPERYQLLVSSVDSSGARTTITGLRSPWHLQLASRPFSGSSSGFMCWLHTDNSSVTGLTETAANSAWGVQRKFMLCTLSCDDANGLIVLHPELIPEERSQFEIAGGQGSWIPEVAFRGTVGYQVVHTPVRTQASGGLRTLESNAIMLYEWETNGSTPGAARKLAGAAGTAVAFGGHLQELTSSRSEFPANAEISGGSLVTPRGCENGFARAPAILAVSSNAGGTLAVGVYQTCVVFEYIDVDGRRHRSPPSNIVSHTVTGAGDDRIVLSISSYSHFERDLLAAGLSTAFHVYCTGTNGSTFFRITPDQGGEPAVDPVAGSSIFTYNISQTPTGGEVLYTDGGVWPNQPSPAHRFGCVAGDRLVVGGGFDPRVVEVSKFFLPNEPPQFTRASPFRSILPVPCTGLAYMDGTIIAFTERGIFTIAASQLPNNQGFPAVPTPEPLPTDVGCIDWRSILEVPAGVVFQSYRGIYLLPRGLGSPIRISAPIQEDLNDNRVIAATLSHYAGASGSIGVDLSSHYAYFAIAASATATADAILVLNVDTMEWESRDVAGDITIMGSFGGRAVLCRTGISADTDLVRENPTGFDDVAGSEPDFSIELGEIHPFGLFGFGKVIKVQVMSTVMNGSSGIELSTRFDGGSPSGEILKTQSGISGINSRQISEFDPGRQRCNSALFRVRVSNTINEGLQLHGIAMLCEPEAGMKNLPSNRRT